MTGLGRAPRRLFAVLAIAAIAALGLVGTRSYALAYLQHRGFSPVRRLPHARVGRLLTVHFYSAALHRRSDYLVYLPPGYSRRQRYPVYYLLHGSPGSPQDFISVVNLDVRLSNRVSEHQLQPMILVMPDGRPGGSTFFDSEWANTRAGAFETYVLNVVRDVDRRFAAIPSRRARVIAGYSAGGYGALNIALHHLAVFANVQSWSGYFVQTRKCCLAFTDASQASLAYNSPLDYARTLTTAELAHLPLRVYMFTGRQDPDGRGIGKMAHELRRAGAVATYNIYPGGHDWQVWYARVDAMMLMASRMVTHPLPIAPATHLTGRPAPLSPTRSRTGTAGARLHARGRLASGLHAARHGRRLTPLAWIGLVLALVSAAMINLGFLIQQRGLAHGMGDGIRAWLAALRSRTWLAGQALGWLGFAVQILAVALAPLSLVQAFIAGGLALSVPLAAGIFGHRVPRLQILAIATVAAGLAGLSLGVPRPGPGMSTAAMLWVTALALATAAAVTCGGGRTGRAIGAGVFYGVADGAIKAVAIGVHRHGVAGLTSGWTLLAAAATFAGFLAFQAALRRDHAVNAIALMTALSTITALVLGVAAFHESLGLHPAITILHLAGIGVVLSCIPVLADPGLNPPRNRRAALNAARCLLVRALRALATVAGSATAVFAAVLTGTGLLYGARWLGWLSLGPRLPDALPLLQLAGFDGQPLARIAAAWLLTGAALGLALIRVRPGARAVIVGAVGLMLVLLASDASFALARNLRLSSVLANRAPTPGAWVEDLLLTVGAVIPRPLRPSLRLPRKALEPVVPRREPIGGRAT